MYEIVEDEADADYLLLLSYSVKLPGLLGVLTKEASMRDLCCSLIAATVLLTFFPLKKKNPFATWFTRFGRIK